MSMFFEEIKHLCSHATQKYFNRLLKLKKIEIQLKVGFFLVHECGDF